MRIQYLLRMKEGLLSSLFLILCIHSTGQNVGIGTTSPQGLLHVSGGNIIVTGVHLEGPMIGTLPVGPRMFFYPRKGAFRAGASYTTAWDDANIGNFSIGLGMNAMAKSDFSVSIGEGNIAEDEVFAVAIGRQNRSAGFASLAMGHFSEATGAYAASIGLRDSVSGFGATALGGYNTVTAAYGIAAGLRNRVDGENAGAFGTDNFSPSFGEFTIGNFATQYTAQSEGDINANDRVFTIGNGQNPGNRSDAMVVLKNGHVGIGTSNPENPLQIATGPGVYTTALSILPSTAEFSKRAEIRLDDWSILQDITGSNNVKDLAIYQYSSGAHRFVISTGGNVGVGTANPAYTFDIRGPNLNESGIISSGNADLSHRLVLFGGHQNDPNPFIQWKAGDPLRFATDAGGFAELMRINPDGNVGIGTSTPLARLGVVGSANITGGDISLAVTPTNGSGNVAIGATDAPQNAKLYVNSNQAYGVFIANNDPGRTALYVLGNATVTGTLSKGAGSFKIDHPLDPENKYLYHSFVESPDMMNVYNGNITTNAQGEAEVAMPDWFEALNRDFRYQLTVIGEFAQAIIKEELKGNKFSILTDKPGVKVSWQITGIRKDQFAEENRIPVEEDKKGEEIGTLLYPSKANKSYSKK